MRRIGRQIGPIHLVLAGVVIRIWGPISGRAPREAQAASLWARIWRVEPLLFSPLSPTAASLSSCGPAEASRRSELGLSHFSYHIPRTVAVHASSRRICSDATSEPGRDLRAPAPHAQRLSFQRFHSLFDNTRSPRHSFLRYKFPTHPWLQVAHRAVCAPRLQTFQISYVATRSSSPRTRQYRLYPPFLLPTPPLRRKTGASLPVCLAGSGKVADSPLTRTTETRRRILPSQRLC